jgi:hypothetical protein
MAAHDAILLVVTETIFMYTLSELENNIESPATRPADLATAASNPTLPTAVLAELAGHKLRDVTNDTRSRAFCGPTAVAGITGEPLLRVRNVFRTVRYGSDWPAWERAPAIRHTSAGNVQKVLLIFGYESHWHTIQGNPTMRAWLERRSGPMRTHPGVLMVTGHWIAFSGSTICDTFSQGQVIDAQDARCLRSRVKGALLIARRGPPCTDILDRQAHRLARKRKLSNDRAAFVRLVRTMGATVDRDDMYLRIRLPSGIGLEMRHWDWAESYSNLASIAADQDLGALERVSGTEVYRFPT